LDACAKGSAIISVTLRAFLRFFALQGQRVAPMEVKFGVHGGVVGSVERGHHGTF